MNYGVLRRTPATGFCSTMAQAYGRSSPQNHRGLAGDAGLDDCLYMGNLDSLGIGVMPTSRCNGGCSSRKHPRISSLRLDARSPCVASSSQPQRSWGGQRQQRRPDPLGRGRCRGTGPTQHDGTVVVPLTRYYRPAKSRPLGDPQKPAKLGGPPPTEEMIAEMIRHDQEEAKKEAYLRRKGFEWGPGKHPSHRS